MEFVNVMPATFEEILGFYHSENGSKQDEWEVENLQRADEKFGSWVIGDIPSSDIGEIVMPHYRIGGAHIISESGAFLNDAHKSFSAKRNYFSRNNPQFCKRVKTQKRIIGNSGKVKRIYLSEEPLFLGASYSGLRSFRGKVTHLDGLHRLFALMDLKENRTPELIPFGMAKR
jgi:hypothetical protein